MSAATIGFDVVHLVLAPDVHTPGAGSGANADEPSILSARCCRPNRNFTVERRVLRTLLHGSVSRDVHGFVRVQARIRAAAPHEDEGREENDGYAQDR